MLRILQQLPEYIADLSLSWSAILKKKGEFCEDEFATSAREFHYEYSQSSPILSTRTIL